MPRLLLAVRQAASPAILRSLGLLPPFGRYRCSAAVIAIVFRLVTTAGDVLYFLAVLVGSRSRGGERTAS